MIRKKEIAKTFFYLGIGLFIMTMIPGIYILGLIFILGAGWNTPNIYRKKYLVTAIRKAFCFYCESKTVSILIYDTPQGKIYEWFCSNCKEGGRRSL